MDTDNVKWSADGETFNADSLEELIDGDDSIGAGSVVHFGEVEQPGTNWVNADVVIELIGERAYDVGGEYAEDFPTISPEAHAELAAFLTAWQAKHCQPTFWTIRKPQDYIVTEADVAQANP